MASTFSDLKVELIGTGEQSGTWGATTNINLGTALEEAIVGRANADFITDADLTISLSDTNGTQVARNYILNVTSSVIGGLTATRNLIVPSIDKPYIVENNTTGGQSIIVKTAAGTGVTVLNGYRVMVYADSTNVVQAQNYIPTLLVGSLSANAITSTIAVANGGTGQTSYTNGQLLIGNTTGNTLTKATLTQGTGIAITNGAGAITVANSAPMTYPLGSGIPVVLSGTSWTTTVAAPSGAIVGTTDTQTLTNKRINPRVNASTANTATPVLNTDNFDMMVITGQSVAITSFTTNLTGTPVNGQKLWISITGTGTIAITWGSSFESSTITLPTTTVSTNRLDVGFVWNAATSKWRCVATA